MAAKPAPAASLVQEITGLIKSVASLIGLAKAAKATPPEPSAPSGKIPTELADIQQEISAMHDWMKAMRDDLFAFGKGLGSVATLALGAIGYTQIHNLFPLPVGTSWGMRAGLIAAAAAGVGGSTFLVVRFFFARRRILMDSYDIPPRVRHKWWHRFDPWAEERCIKHDVARRYAKREGMHTLAEVADEAARLAGEAQGQGGKKWEQAYRLEQIINLALYEAATKILERRTRGAFGGVLASIALVLAVGGIGFLFGAADWSKGVRGQPEQRIREAQACIARVEQGDQAEALRAACIAKAKADLGK